MNEIKINDELKNLIAPLDADEYEILEKSILEKGVTVDIQLWNGFIVDGHNRYEIATRHGINFNTKDLEFDSIDDVKLYIIDTQMGRRNINAFAKLELQEKKRNIIKKKAKENLKTSTGGHSPQPLPTLAKAEKINTRKEIAKAAGTSHGTVSKYDKIKEQIDETTREKLRKGDLTINEVFNEIKNTNKKAEIQKLKNDINEGKFILPEGKFQIIMMDVPWPYEGEYASESFMGRVQTPYPRMSLNEINELEIPADENCILFFWTTQKFLHDAFHIVEHYGFEYKGLITWDKVKMGVGMTLRMQCEYCMVCFKGKPIWGVTDLRDIITESRREHSRKPDLIYNLINEKLVGNKLDYFSRENRDGWQTFGYEKFNNK